MAEPERDPALERLLDFLRVNRGFDFTGYKRASLSRRIRARMTSVGIEDYELYLNHLEVHPGEFQELFNTILINVTDFFRDSEAWRFLASEALPSLLARRGADEWIRVWSAGCATGEEVYTVAMLLAEHLGEEDFKRRVKIYATDADQEELVKARRGFFREDQVGSVPGELLERYFEPAEGGFVFRNPLRRSIIFGLHDVVHDAPISNLDLLLCRNTLMFFNREIQDRILVRFHFALAPHGLLFLGKSEMMVTGSKLFTPLSLKHRIFARANLGESDDTMPAISPKSGEAEPRGATVPRQLHEVAFDELPEPHLVTDAQFVLRLANRSARSLFGISQADIGRQFHELRLSYQPCDLRTPLEKVLSQREVQQVGQVDIASNDEGGHFEILVVPLAGKGQHIMGASVIFRDVTSHKDLQLALEQAARDREAALEQLQSANEELETTNEELQSANEELETTNEELQSTNEELETANEEMQSTNEELQTVHQELHVRSEQVHQINVFLNSILTNLEKGVIALDRNFSVMEWNRHAEKLWGLRAQEARGRSMFDLDIGLPFELLRDPVRACLRGASEREEFLVEATNRRGRRFLCRVICTVMKGDSESQPAIILFMEEWFDQRPELIESHSSR